MVAGLVLVANGGVAAVLTAIAALIWTPAWLAGHVFAVAIAVLGATMATLGMPGTKPSALRRLARLSVYGLWLWPIVVAGGVLGWWGDDALLLPAVASLFHVGAMLLHLTSVAGRRWAVVARYVAGLFAAYGVPLVVVLTMLGELVDMWYGFAAAVGVSVLLVASLVVTAVFEVWGRAFRGSTPRVGSDAWKAWEAMAARQGLQLLATDWGVQLAGEVDVQLILQDLPHRIVVQTRCQGLGGTWVWKREGGTPSFHDVVLDLVLDGEGPGLQLLARHPELTLELFSGHPGELAGGRYVLEASGKEMDRYVTLVRRSCAPTPELELLLERLEELRALF